MVKLILPNSMPLGALVLCANRLVKLTRGRRGRRRGEQQHQQQHRDLLTPSFLPFVETFYCSVFVYVRQLAALHAPLQSKTLFRTLKASKRKYWKNKQDFPCCSVYFLFKCDSDNVWNSISKRKFPKWSTRQNWWHFRQISWVKQKLLKEIYPVEESKCYSKISLLTQWFSTKGTANWKRFGNSVLTILHKVIQLKMASTLMKKMAKTAVTAKVAGFNKPSLKNVIGTTKTSNKNRLEVTAAQVNN